MYVAGRDHPLRESARFFLQKVRDGEVEAFTSVEVLQEILYRYAGLKRRDTAREVYELFAQLCGTVLPVTVADTDRAVKLVSGPGNIGVRDAIHAAVMLNNRLRYIATFDKEFDGIEGVERLD